MTLTSRAIQALRQPEVREGATAREVQRDATDEDALPRPGRKTI
jgi:hypothetical protein